MFSRFWPSRLLRAKALIIINEIKALKAKLILILLITFITFDKKKKPALTTANIFH